MRKESQQFAYWSLVLDLEMLHSRFVRSLREGHFDLYVQVIDELCGWLFMFDPKPLLSLASDSCEGHGSTTA